MFVCIQKFLADRICNIFMIFRVLTMCYSIIYHQIFDYFHCGTGVGLRLKMRRGHWEVSRRNRFSAGRASRINSVAVFSATNCGIALHDCAEDLS